MTPSLIDQARSFKDDEPIHVDACPPWVQIQGGAELSDLVRIVRVLTTPQGTFLHNEYEACGLLWHWLLKWAKPASGASLLVSALLDALLTAAQEQEHLQVERDAQRERFAAMMIRCSIATGHGDTMDDLIAELEVEVTRLRAVISTYGQHTRECETQMRRIAPGHYERNFGPDACTCGFSAFTGETT